MRKGILAPVAVVVVAVASGGWLLQQGVDRAERRYSRARLFQEVVERVESSFVDSVDASRLYETAIDGLLRELGDPYSSFLPAEAYEDLRIRTEGDYGGVGLEVIQRNGYVTVVAPIPGTPGARSGIRPGDQFYEIEGVRADTMNTDRAVDLLRGRPGSEVRVKMLRPGIETPIPFTLTRAVIRIRAVPFSVVLEDGVGYVPLQSVMETASAEVRAAVDSLVEQGARALVLDLRGNPGGLLEEGIAVSDLFLERGKTVVETRGRAADQSESFRATRPERFPGLPVVVMVDGTSASASEIVAGALQDHDRALVVGETTFGKGVVQSLYRLTGGNVLRLTTARWYTPLGRSIQKENAERMAEMEEGHMALALSGQLVSPPDLEGRPTVRSERGRVLYGGGGITPDVLVAPVVLTEEEEEAVRTLYREAGQLSVALFNFAVRYIQERPDLEPEFRVSDQDLRRLYRALPEWDVQVEEDQFWAAARFVRYQAEREIAIQAWGQRGEFLQMRGYDAQLDRALALLEGVQSVEELLARAPTPAVGAAEGS